MDNDRAMNNPKTITEYCSIEKYDGRVQNQASEYIQQG